MKELANLCRIVTSRGLGNISLLDVDLAVPTKEMQLVGKLLQTPDITQNQLVRELYGQSSAANMAAFWQLRARLQGKLLNHLYFLDHSDPRYPVGRRHEMAIWQMLHQATVLQAEGEYALATQRLRRALLLAERDDYLGYAVMAARLLRSLYANQRQPAAYQAMGQTYARLRQRLSCEEEAESLHLDIRNAITGPVAAKRALLPTLPASIARLAELHEQAQTFTTATFLYRARLTQQEMLGNYPEILRITQAAEAQLRAGELNERRFDLRYNHFMTVYAYLRSRQPARGLELAAQYEPDFHPSSNNWFAFQENHVLLALHAGHYELAQTLLGTVLKNPFYAKQRAAGQQRWELYRAYLEFLLPAGAGISPVRTPASVAQWALQLPDFNRDKRGYHVAILILQLLYYLRRRNLDEVMLRLERLRKYQQLHLRDEDTLRSRLFLRLLAILPEKDFQARACAERGQNLLAKLREAPQPGEAYAQIEVVPYEELWELTLQLLRQGVPTPAPAGGLTRSSTTGF